MAKQQPYSLPPLDLSSGLDVTREQVSDVYMAGTSDGILFDARDRVRDAASDETRQET